MPTSICISGLGLMGRPITRHLIDAGWIAQGWNRSPLPEALIEGIPLCRDLAEAARADVCLCMLLDSQAVGDVLERLEPQLAAGQSVMDMGSSDPEQSKVHAARLATKGIGWIDAPVSGGPEGAATSTLAIAWPVMIESEAGAP